jgi:hypothetical protein
MKINKYINMSNNLLKLYGDILIIRIDIVRKPIERILQNSLFLFNNTPYDKLFHLQMVCMLSNNMIILIEKNENINIYILNHLFINNKTEVINVNISNNLTINTMFNNTINKYGETLFYKYDVINNCQEFILMILNSNNLNNDELQKFIKQNTESIFRNWPTLKNVSNFFIRLYSNIKIVSD